MKILIPLIFLISIFKASEDIPLHLLPHIHSKNKSTHSHHGKKSTMYKVVGYKDNMSSDLKYILSTLEKKDITIKNGYFKLPRSFYANYHAISANLQIEDQYFSAVYYIYKHGKPSRTSPTKLTSMQKSDFEIQPIRLPREHDRYSASKEYSFIVKLQNKPLSNQLIKINTLNGTSIKLFTDENGNFTLTLPNDFKDVKTGRRANPPSYYILSSFIQRGDKKYHTTFTSPYHVNPNDYWSNIPSGFAVAGIGLLTGLLILKRRKNG